MSELNQNIYKMNKGRRNYKNTSRPEKDWLTTEGVVYSPLNRKFNVRVRDKKTGKICSLLAVACRQTADDYYAQYLVAESIAPPCDQNPKDANKGTTLKRNVVNEHWEDESLEDKINFMVGVLGYTFPKNNKDARLYQTKELYYKHKNNIQ